MRVRSVKPILNVSDVRASLAWFEQLGWQTQFTWRDGDEEELGFTYREADLAIVCLEELKLDVDGAAAHSGVDRDVVERVKARVDAVAWKHHVPHAL